MTFCSIITVTRNNLAGLEATGRSVAMQRPGDYEWIVIDGGSRDGTAAWLAAYARTHEQVHASAPAAARWLSEPDNGIYDAMNKGMREARGDYLLFLNAGDLLASENLLADIKITLSGLQDPPDFIYGDALEAGHPKPARPHTALADGMFTHHQAMLYRRAHMEGLRYDTAYEIAADYDLTCRFLLRPARAFYYPLPICIFETGGISQQRVRIGRREQSRIRRQLGLAGPVRNAVIEARQCLAWNLRRHFGGLYWFLKGLRPRHITARRGS